MGLAGMISLSMCNSRRHRIKRAAAELHDTDIIGDELHKINHIFEASQGLKDMQGMLRIVVSNYQVVGMLPAVLNMKFPDRFSEMVGLLKLLALDLLRVFSIDCQLHLSFEKYVCAMCVPPVLIGLVVAIGTMRQLKLSDMIGTV